MKPLMLAVLLLAASVQAAASCPNQFAVGYSYVPYCSNGKPGAAVFVIHGTDRNAAEYLSYLEDLDTLVIAPEFQPAGPGIYWATNGWSRGSESSDATRVSSYEVLDRMVVAFNGKAVMGHSAGGQFVTRYAAGTRRPGLTFIAANAGTYMYLDGTRPVAGSCTDYNDYKYGLDDLNSYMSQGVAPDYPDRNVLYLLGGNDTLIDSGLDTSCAANRQGANRLERGMNFFLHLAAHYGRRVHRQVIVDGVGHSGRRMMEAAMAYLPELRSPCASCH